MKRSVPAAGEERKRCSVSSACSCWRGTEGAGAVERRGGIALKSLVQALVRNRGVVGGFLFCGDTPPSSPRADQAETRPPERSAAESVAARLLPPPQSPAAPQAQAAVTPLQAHSPPPRRPPPPRHQEPPRARALRRPPPRPWNVWMAAAAAVGCLAHPQKPPPPPFHSSPRQHNHAPHQRSGLPGRYSRPHLPGTARPPAPPPAPTSRCVGVSEPLPLSGRGASLAMLGSSLADSTPPAGNSQP